MFLFYIYGFDFLVHLIKFLIKGSVNFNRLYNYLVIL